MLENKRIEKDRFSGPKGSTGRGYGQPAQSVGEPIDRLPLPDRGPIEECQKHTLSSSSLLFSVEVPSFPIEALANRLNRLGNRSTGCPCPVEVWSRDAQNLIFLPIASSSRSRFISSRSRSGRGNGNLPQQR